MIIRHRGIEPRIDPDAYVAPTAVVAGHVAIGPRSRIMFGAVLNSEGSRIMIGECVIVCENAVLRATAAGDEVQPVSVGNHVFISPRATLLGCTVESGAYIATGATILQGAVIRPGAVVAVGALVHAGAVIPADCYVPPNTVAVGNPVRFYGTDEKEEVVEAIRSIGFTKIAFDIDPGENERVKKAAEVRSKEFESHFKDRIISK